MGQPNRDDSTVRASHRRICDISMILIFIWLSKSNNQLCTVMGWTQYRTAPKAYTIMGWAHNREAPKAYTILGWTYNRNIAANISLQVSFPHVVLWGHAISLWDVNCKGLNCPANINYEKICFLFCERICILFWNCFIERLSSHLGLCFLTCKV